MAPISSVWRAPGRPEGRSAQDLRPSSGEVEASSVLMDPRPKPCVHAELRPTLDSRHSRGGTLHG